MVNYFKTDQMNELINLLADLRDRQAKVIEINREQIKRAKEALKSLTKGTNN